MDIKSKNSDVKQSKNNGVHSDEKIADETQQIKKISRKKMMWLLLIILAAIIVTILIFIWWVSMALKGQDYMAEVTYDTPNEPKIQTETVTQTIPQDNNYVIGATLNDLVTGNEVEFTTTSDTIYYAAEDFPLGTYDIVAIDGYGEVSIDSTNNPIIENMSSDVTHISYLQKYDNYTFTGDEKLSISGDVIIKLIPQQKDDVLIEPGVYKILATSGNGHVSSSGSMQNLNVVMGVDTKGGSYINDIKGHEFVQGEELTVPSVTLKLTHEAPFDQSTPMHKVTEKLIINTGLGGYRCFLDDKEVECSTLKYYWDLEANILEQQNITPGEQINKTN